MLRKAILSVGFAAWVTTGCGGSASIAEAGDKIDPPIEFSEVERKTLDGFELTSREYTYSTEVSQRQACELAAETLRNWAGQDVVESQAPGLPRTLCSYSVRNPERYPSIDAGFATVARLATNGEFELDENAPGGVDEIAIFFQTDN